MIINNYKLDRVNTLDRASLITFDIYRSYKDGKLSVDTIASLLHDILNNSEFNNNSHVHASICKIFLDLRKNDLITDDDVAGYLDSKNSLYDGFLLEHIVTINKYFKIIPMCRLFDIIMKTNSITKGNIEEYILKELDNNEDIENTIYYIDLFNRIRIRSNISQYQYDCYINKIKSLECIINEDPSKSNFANKILHNYDKNISMISFTNKVMYEMNKIAYDKMFAEDKDIAKNIYYNIEKENK